MSVPLLLISDAPTASTGFGRITKDIATRIATNLAAEYRVATFGYGGPCSRHLPFHQYIIEGMRDDWVTHTLPDVWRDWAGEERGVVLHIWDSSRLTWYAQPDMFPELLEDYPGLGKRIKAMNAEKWLYCPVDSEGPGPNGALSFPLKATLFGFDRIITYTKFGENVIRKTMGDVEADKRHITNLPHGVDPEIFFEMPRQACRKAFFTRTGAAPMTNKKPEPIQDGEILITCVATNQTRKDWALVFEMAAILGQERRVRLWAHTDAIERYWSLAALATDFNLVDRTVVSLGVLPDEQMAIGYSACDLSIAPGAEGFGLPALESVSCGTPCLTMNYAAGAEVLGSFPEFLVDPIAYRYDGLYASRRPVHSAQQWAERAEKIIGKRTNQPTEYDWGNVWPRWQNYFRAAAKEGTE